MKKSPILMILTISFIGASARAMEQMERPKPAAAGPAMPAAASKPEAKPAVTVAGILGTPATPAIDASGTGLPPAPAVKQPAADKRPLTDAPPAPTAPAIKSPEQPATGKLPVIPLTGEEKKQIAQEAQLLTGPLWVGSAIGAMPITGLRDLYKAYEIGMRQGHVHNTRQAMIAGLSAQGAVLLAIYLTHLFILRYPNFAPLFYSVCTIMLMHIWRNELKPVATGPERRPGHKPAAPSTPSKPAAPATPAKPKEDKPESGK